MLAMIDDEIARIEQELEANSAELQELLVPQDPRDAKNVIVEIRAGAGGDEAGLFAADLYRMYTMYAAAQGWKTNLLSANETGIGGYKEIVFEVKGRGAYSRLKFESGVHRVQRVPVTETSGRIHTSTATVAVLPQADEFELQIDEVICASTSIAPGARAARVSTPPILLYASRIFPPAWSSVPERTFTVAEQGARHGRARARLYDLQYSTLFNERDEKRRAQVRHRRTRERSARTTFRRTALPTIASASQLSARASSRARSTSSSSNSLPREQTRLLAQVA